MNTTEPGAAFRRRSWAWLLVGAGAVVSSGATAAFAQDPVEIRGEAILKHPIGDLAIKAAELMRTGKIEQAVQLGTKEDQSEWKKSPADEKEHKAALWKERAPAPAAYRDAIRKAGLLTIEGPMAKLVVPFDKGKEVIAAFELEGGTWRRFLGPMVMAGSSAPAKETRIQGADILKHPIGALALQYADLLHAGKMDDVMRLATAEAQAKWKADSPRERAESAAYFKNTVPKRAALSAAIQSGGLLIIEDDALASLNLIQSEQRSTTPGVVTSTSTTTSIGFAMEDGQWKLTQ
jgi:hypothetical protein